jgi:O-succinylbenzoic acid--CoA ligase
MRPWPTHEAARRFGDRPALITPGQTVSHHELARRVEAVATRLAGRGIRPGDTVALWDANGLDWVVAAHAVWRAGATLLPLSMRWTDLEVRSALERLEPALMLGGQDFADRAAAIGVPALSHKALEGTGGGALPGALDDQATMAMLLTSGTSGVPKAAMLSWAAMMAGAEGVGRAIALAPSDRWWLAMPFFHVGGLSALLRCARFGAAAVVAARFEADRALAELERHGVTVASVVPTMLSELAARLGDRPWPPALRLAMLGGAAASPELVAACPVACPSYGLTEACSTVTLVRPGSAARTTSGPPIPGVEVAILGPEGEPIAAGEEGEIAVAGPTLMRGYAGDPAASAAVRAGRWLRTGDFGRLDAAGCLTVLGRRTDLIVSGGENIYPAEVEAAIAAHPAVAAAAVVGAPSRRWGASPFAFVAPAAGEIDEATLRDWLDGRLARFKQPRGYAFMPALPLLANGKVDRRALRAELDKRGYEVP